MCQFHECKLVLIADDVFIENHSDDTQEAQIAQQGHKS